MKNKKLWLVLVLLFVSGALFGQIGPFQYVTNMTEQDFITYCSVMMAAVQQNSTYSLVGKLPNTITQAIGYALDDYSLAVGDVFGTSYRNYNTNTEGIILLRITDVRNKRYQAYALERAVS